MPEFRDRYDIAAVSDRISQPSFTELAHRGRDRAYRIRRVRLAGVAVVAALAVTSLLTLPSQTGPSTPAASPPPSLEPGLWRMTFLNVDFGIATNWDQTTCIDALFVTDDGGSTWSEPRHIPDFPGRKRIDAQRYCLVPDVIPVAPDTLVIPLDSRIEHEYVSERMDPPTTSYISRDAGRTWQEYEPRIRTADAAPDGVVPDVYCEAEFRPGEYDSPLNDWCVGQPRVSWYDPQTGDRMVLRNNPQAEWFYTPEVAGDGSIWAGGHDSDGNHHISVSRDRGRTWRDVSPPPAEDAEDVDEPTSAAVAAADGNTAYFYSHTESAWPARQTPIYRTTDGGETWQPLPAAQRFLDVAGMWVVGDGALLVELLTKGEGQPRDGLVAYLSHDGGDTFDTVELSATVVVQISGGFRGYAHDFSAEGAVDAVSEDGLNWRVFDRPEFRLPR
jgi:hypothetical protein